MKRRRLDNRYKFTFGTRNHNNYVYKNPPFNHKVVTVAPFFQLFYRSGYVALYKFIQLRNFILLNNLVNDPNKGYNNNTEHNNCFKEVIGNGYNFIDSTNQDLVDNWYITADQISIHRCPMTGNEHQIVPQILLDSHH